VRTDRDEGLLVGQIVAEVGTPVGLTFAIQQDTCIDDMQWDIDLIDRYEWEYELGNHEFFGMNSNRLVIREPIGVVGAITPWNFPFMLNLSKLAPALAAGCTTILKPAPDTPYSATWIGKLVAEETDIPAGVFNVVTASDPAAVGDVLTGSPAVDMISFTGSTAVGKHIAARSAANLKRVFLELGGKSANIVLDDANLDRIRGCRFVAIEASFEGAFVHEGRAEPEIGATAGDAEDHLFRPGIAQVDVRRLGAHCQVPRHAP
jgi:aldehyde dehydrogenase (NAD+)